MLKLDGISSFVAIAEAASISAAARRLQLSKSVVSERLADGRDLVEVQGYALKLLKSRENPARLRPGYMYRSMCEQAHEDFCTVKVLCIRARMP